jgi:hypothetical protein
MKKFLTLILFFCCIGVYSQNENNWWYFGQNAVLDFNSGSPVSNQLGSVNSLESCSTISDSSGNVLFYTDGSTIWNRLGQPLPNGTGLDGNASTAQNLLIKDNSSPNRYLFITVNPFSGIRYSIIDRNLDNGKGDVVAGRKNILINSISSERIHGFTGDLNFTWIVSFNDGIFYAYPAGGGIILPARGVVSDLSNTTISNLTDSRGIIKISPDGTKIAVSSIGNTDGAFIADFDSSTGIVSNPLRLTNNSGTFNRTYGLEFSPDSNFLYIESNLQDTANSCTSSNVKKIFQYEINSSSNWNSTPIDISGDLVDSLRGALQLAPNGKIYVAKSCTPTLGVINNPNQLGLLSSYVDNSVQLFGSSTSREGLPNMIYSGLSNLGNQIVGTSRLDIDNNGCDTVDPIFPYLRVNIQSATDSYTAFSNLNGEYLNNVVDGSYSVDIQFENPSYWNGTPTITTVDFPSQTSPFTQDFCITTNNAAEDLEVVVVPLVQARPGFSTDYKVTIKNKGTVTTSGTVSLDFEENFMTLISSNPSAVNTPTNRLSWTFSNLQPFETVDYQFTMSLNTPTQALNPLNAGDTLTFTGTVASTGTDVMPADNVMVFDQIVVNSFDPNDKTCLEGETIEPTMVGDYVHYIIRFENNGTAAATNVIIEDFINLNSFDLSTITPLGGSHDYNLNISGNNRVQFIMENINLDFNDATNDGYVLFKIKTLSTLTVGDTFQNSAQIYFDFNAPIITNTETVTVMTTASIEETTDSSISIFPNPAKDVVNIHSMNNLKSAAIIDINGRMLSKINFTGTAMEQSVSLENLTSGVYFITIQSEVGQKVEKVIVE